MTKTEALFTAVADALIASGADNQTKHDVLAALMDQIGVPMMLLEQYRAHPAIVGLFAERGVRFAAPDERVKGA